MLKRTCAPLVIPALAGAAGLRRSFQAGRILDPQLRQQLPSPLQRDEFTVLKRLARTADTEADTLPHYVIDDSMFLRYRSSTIALARRSGRNMARFVLDKNAAQIAVINKDCPPVAAWRPLRPLNELECSESSLQLLIGLEQVGLSWQMYNKLISDGNATVSNETKQSLLELLAYHAGGEPPYRDISPEEIYFAFRSLPVKTARWGGTDNPAIILYASMKPPSLAAKAAMLKAHQRHGSHAECLAIYSQVANDPQLDSESHNCALLATAAHTGSWQATLKLFRGLPSLSVAAYRCLLNGLAAANKDVMDQASRAKLACSILAEMAARGLPRTLGVCTAAMRAVYKDQLNVFKGVRLNNDDFVSNPGQPEACVGFLPSLIDSLIADPPDPLDGDSADDLAFFPAAAFLACRVYASPALSQQLDTLLHTGAFTSTFATLLDRSLVYEYHMLNLLTKRSVPLDATFRFYVDRVVPSGTAQLTHIVRLMRKCVDRQAVDLLPALMLQYMTLVDQLDPGILRPGLAFFRCAEICDQMFADGHPATRDADFLANLRRCLLGFADALNNELVYRERKKGDKERQELNSSLTAESCTTVLRLAARIPGAADEEREFSLQLAGLLSECLKDMRTSSLDYMLAMMELAASIRASPRYEHRVVCQSVAELLDRAAHEFSAKRSDKSDVGRLGRLADLAESANAYLESNGYQLTNLQAAAHHRLAKGAAELRDRGGDAAFSRATDAVASELQDESAWAVESAVEVDADLLQSQGAHDSVGGSADSNEDAGR